MIFGLSWTVMGQSAEDLFKQANAAYKQGDYQTAVSKYEKALQTGKVSPELYYNLGNVYYKLNEIAPSIYYYEEAKKLNPNDEDIKYNLGLANQMKLDKIDQVPENILLRWKKKVNAWFSYNNWAWLSIFSAFFGVLVFSFFVFSKNPNTKRWAFFAMFISLFMLLFSWYNAEYGYSLAKQEYAIVFADATDLMTEPNLTSDRVVSIHEGTKVKVLKQEDNWVLVKLPDGKKAWLPKEDIRVIE